MDYPFNNKESYFTVAEKKHIEKNLISDLNLIVIGRMNLSHVSGNC